MVKNRKAYMRRIVSVLSAIIMMISMITINTIESKADESMPNVNYMVHRQTYGWENGWKNSGDTSGTVGEAKRLEGIKIKIADYQGLGVEYRTHIQSYGWESAWKKDGEMSGTEGQSKRLEAIQVRLTGELAEYYDIYYRVHAQSYGWLGWAKNGESAGTAGQSKRLEAIQIVVLPKGGYPEWYGFEGSMGCAFVDIAKKPSETASGAVSYMTHVQGYGNQAWVSDGSIAGTSGEAKRLEAISIKINNSKLYDSCGGIEYRTHVQSYGWLDWVSDGDASGTSGQAKRLEAVKIRLTGDLNAWYDVYYRVHAQSYGWLGWAKNGETAGTEGLAKRLEAIQIVIVPKGTEAPNSLPAGKETPAFYGTDTSVDKSKMVYVYSWNNELGDRIEYFYDKYPQYREYVEVINLGIGATSDEYKAQIKSALSASSSKPASIVAFDEAVSDEFVGSSSFVTAKSVGITDKDYSNAYTYTKQRGSYNGKLKFLSWQASPGGFVYRTDIAQAVWGESDPEFIQSKVKDWDTFLATAEELKEAGYYILSGPDDVQYARGCDYTSVKKDSVYKTLVSKKYTTGSEMWDDKWNLNFTSDNVFGYFGCPWFVNWSINDYPGSDTYGKRNVCAGPAAYSWGGTYLGITENCQNKELAALLVKTLCCDEDVMYRMSEETLDYVNNSKVIEKLIKNGWGAMPELGGQNPLSIWNENGKKITYK